MLMTLFASASLAAPDLYIRDTASDIGVEPYAGPGPVYLSPDIWVRNEPDPNHEPYPFSTASPPWTPLPHQNPEYRDSKTGQPNYVYVRIQNRGDQPSSGTDRLRLYQAKASTGLAWPASWVDNVDPICGADHLVGIEITKPRRNAQSVSAAERDAYRDALLAIQSDPQLRYSDGVQYWRKQNAIHAGAGNPQHGNPAFLAWHREMMNRYEERLREANPLVTLLYWDWTVDPRTGTNLFATSFMGASNGTVAAPLTPLEPPTLRRGVGGTATNLAGNIVCAGSLFESDASFNVIGDFQPLALAIEGGPNHDCAHGYIGGYTPATAGQISFLNTAAQDPFFFLLHANVDRLWANWQRQGDAARLDPVAIYGADSSNTQINATMSPWDGATSMAPWTGPAAYGKTSKHRSVVYPPVYDTAPLNIPALQPGESVVVEVPWYPPDVNNYNCAGQAGHFCLLARIETDQSSPFGMTFAEGSNVGTNTRNNNNIAWKNVTIVDDVVEPALRLVSGTMVRNIFRREAIFEIALHDRTEERRFLLPELARLALVLPDDILERLRGRDARLQDLEFVRDESGRRMMLQVAGKEPRFSVALKPNESFTAELVVSLPDRDIPRALLQEPFHLDIEQRIDLPPEYFAEKGEEALNVGGVRFTLDFVQILKEREARRRQIVPADLRLEVVPAERKMLAIEAMEADQVQHLSVGEPLSVVVNRTGDIGEAMRVLSLELDNRQVTAAEQSDTLSETIRFDEPGVHTITARGIGEDGEVTTRRIRVLVSENIPPNAVITSPEPGAHVRLGEEVDVAVEAAAAYQREVREVSLYVKEGDAIFTGLNLVLSEAYEPVATAEGPGPHRFSFTPERPGTYMFQAGVVDDRGITGVSGHAMIMVAE
ncbi:MAG TPA: tyrosinase family protein [Afifellaceae bacterium]|nr:tyrosinase family protein [Afifellaceae bacterium]